MIRRVLLAAGFCLALASLAPGAEMTVSKKTYSRLEKAFGYISVEKYEDARQILESLDGKKDLNDHEQALVHQTLGYVESSLGRYAQAVTRFEKCLALGAMPNAAMLSTRYDLAQMYLAIEQYDKAARTLETWFAEAENPGAGAFQLLATAYVQLGQLQKALPHAKKAVELSPEPNEGRLQLLLSIYLQTNEYRPAIPLLERLIEHFPRPPYWKQLAALYVELDRTREALAVLQVANVQGLLTTSRELETLAQLYLANDVPYRAAKVLSEAIETKRIEPEPKTWRLVGEAWLAAREYERAVAPLEKAAAGLGDGRILVQLAQVHMAREKWDRAKDTLRRALGQKRLDDRGRALLLLGVAAASGGDRAAARRAFEQARAFPDHEKEADGWLRHLDYEEAKYADAG